MKDFHASDRAARRITDRQFGVITSTQGQSVGLSARQMEQRVTDGIWRRCHAGVYVIAGVGDSPRARLLAACLAGGPTAVASHLSAAWILGLVPHAPLQPAITVPYENRPRLHDVEIHRSRDLDLHRTLVRRGVPHTDAGRTICDLAGTLERPRLIAIVDRALSDGLVTTARLLREAERRSGRGRSGPARLRKLLLERGLAGGPEPSVLEAESMRLFQRFQIPVLRREVHAGRDGRYRIDFLIAPGLAVEVDGFAYHWSPEAKAYDEARRNQLRLAGMFVLVYNWRDIRFDQHRVAREIHLARRALQPAPEQQQQPAPE